MQYKDYKVGIIGYKGRVAQRHIKAWNALGIKWVGCDSKQDYRVFMLTSGITMVDICTPIYLHAEMIKAAVEYKIPVICEKPLALNIEEAKELTKLRGKIGIIYQFRYNPKILKLKKEIQEGKYGEIKLVTAQYYRWRGPEYYQKWEADSNKAGGGVTFNVCIHYFDLMQWMFGYPKEIKGMITTAKPELDIEDNSVSIMKFPSGALGAVILSTHVNPPKHFEFSIYGTKGHKTIQLRQNEYHKENFEAFLKNEGFVDPLEASKSLKMTLDVIGGK